MLQSVLQSVSLDRRGRDWLIFFLVHALIVAAFLALLAIDARAEVVSPGRSLSPWMAIALEAFAPLIVTVAATIAAIVMAIAGFLMRRGLALFNVKIDESFAKSMNDGLERGATLALERLGDRLKGGIPVDAKGKAVSIVANYTLESYPDAVQHFGKTYAELRQMAEIRLNGLIVEPADEQRLSRALQPEGS